MTQANDVLETLEPSQSNLDDLLVEERDDRDDGFEGPSESEEETQYHGSGAGGATRPRVWG